MAATSTDDKVWGIEIMYDRGKAHLPSGHDSVPDSTAKHIAVMAKTLPDHVEEFRVIVNISGEALNELRSS